MKGLLYIALFLALQVLLSGCGEERELTNLKNVPPNVVSIDSTIIVEPGPFQGATKEKVASASPSSVELRAELKGGADGGFVLVCTWQYEGNNPSSWEVVRFIDRNDGRDPLSYETTEYLGADTLTWESPVLYKNRKYEFILKSDVMSGNGEASGKVAFKRVTVNLRGLP